jgi:hypothetical protein
MSKPGMRVIQSESSPLGTDAQKAAREANQRRYQATKAKFARDALAWSTNLVDARQYRACPDGCGLVIMSRHNPGAHIDPAELIADWQEEEADERLEDFDLDAVYQAPINVPLKPAVSQAQVLWARDMIAQYPKKSREQISRENGGISWAQLEHYARTPLAGLPERKGQKAPVMKQTKTKAPKAKATSKKTKGGIA